MRRTMGLVMAGTIGLGGAPAEAAAPTAPLEARAEDVAKHFRAKPTGLEELFAKAFLDAVPPDQIAGIFGQFHAQLGDVTRTRRLAGGDAHHGTFEYAFAKGYTVKADLAVAETPPHRITGLMIGNPAPLAQDLAAVAAAFAKLPGQATFAVARLGAKGPEIKAAHEPDRALAIGSGFKLWILGALIDEVAAGKRRWDQVLPLTAAARSLPGGRLHTWPEGAPLTLHTLASAMISESDNTATDELLYALGRERVERAMAAMGVADAARNRPMLSTLEMFKLKAGPDAQATQAWRGLDEAGRRAYLKRLAAVPRDAVTSWSAPRALDVEWHASAADLARTMAWLRDHTEKGEAGKGRGVLAINPGIRLDKAAWSYVGFKGGSEPGVVSGSFLLRGADGAWWTITAAWNDPAAEVDTGRLFGLVERTADLVAAPH